MIKLKIYKINHTRGESDNPMLWPRAIRRILGTNAFISKD